MERRAGEKLASKHMSSRDILGGKEEGRTAQCCVSQAHLLLRGRKALSFVMPIFMRERENLTIVLIMSLTDAVT